MKTNNITNLNEYKDNIMPDLGYVENIDEDMIRAYLEASDMETPDLWSRIEAGVEEEFEEIKRKNSVHNSKKAGNIIGVVAAAILITIIVLPLAKLGRIGSGDKSCDSITTEATTECAPYEGDFEEGVSMNTEAACESTNNAESVCDTNESVSDENKMEGVADTRKLVIVGEIVVLEENDLHYGIIVQQIITNEYEAYDIEEGDIILVDNCSVIEDSNLSKSCWEFELQNLLAEDGEYVGKIEAFKETEKEF